MKNKTPALEAEVLCKALVGYLHRNPTLPTYRAQRLAGFYTLRFKAAANAATVLAGGAHD